MVGVALLLGVGMAQGAEGTIARKCAGDWPGDYEMQAYCQRNQREAVAELQQLRATHGGIPADAYKTALAGCVHDWPDDFEMQAYCLRNQIEGYAAVASGPSSPLVTLTPEEVATIERHCSAEWPDDFEMQAYCTRQQGDGVAYLRTQPAGYARDACAQQWPGDYEMQAYCVREGLY